MAHARHRPRRTANDSSGTLSYQAIGAPQPGHAERGAQRLRRSGRRAITTLRKLPRTRPNTTTTARPISETMLRDHVTRRGGMQLAHEGDAQAAHHPAPAASRRGGMQLAQDGELLAHLLRVACAAVGEHEADAGLCSERLLCGRTA